jgi:hypothetical protein
VGGIERNIKRYQLAYGVERINGKSPSLSLIDTAQRAKITKQIAEDFELVGALEGKTAEQ